MAIAVDLRDEAALCRRQGVNTYPSDVVAVSQAEGGDPVFLCFRDSKLNRPHGGHLAPGIVAIEERRSRRLPDHLDLGTGIDLALAGMCVVLGQPDDAMGVVPGQLGFDKVVRDDAGILPAAPHRLDQVG